MKNNIKSFIALDFVALLLIFLLLNLQYFLEFFNFTPIHDTAVVLQMFSFFYNEFYVNNIMPLWLPYSLYGVSSDVAITTTIAPSQFFVMAIGKLLQVKDTLMLFKISVIIEALALFVGIYSLARRFFQNKAAIIFVCLGAIAIPYWGIQIFFNLRLYYLLPMCLFFLIKFFDFYDFKYLWITGIIAVISLIGNVTYFAPLFLFIFVTFMFLLFMTKRNYAAIKMRNIFTLPSLSLLSVFILLSFIYVDYIARMFDYIKIYSPGRNPLNHQTTLTTFLTYAGATSVRSLLEFIHAIPFSNDFFIYIGLIPLVFLIYAVFHLRGIRRDNPVFIPLLIISIMLIMFSLGSFGGIAILLYYTFPGMSYFRHIGYVKVIAKIVLLIVAGFGMDYYLNIYRSGSREKEDRKLERFSPAYVGIALISLIVIINILVFLLKYKYKTIYPLNNFLLYQFHLFSVFILALFCYFSLKQFNNKRIISHIIVIFYFIEIVSYCFIMFYSLPAKGIKPQAGNAVKTAEYSKEADLYKTAFNVREYPFRNERVNRDKMYAIRSEMPLVLQTTYMPGIFAVYFHIYSAFYVDSCLQEYRTDYMPLSFDHLIRARLGIAFDSMNVMPSIYKDHYFMQAIAKDEDFMRAIGCNTSKIRFVLNPVIVPDLNAAAMMIKESPDLNEKPIILESSNSEYGRLLLVESSLRHNGKPEDSLKSANPVNTKSLDIKFDVMKFTANMIEIAADAGSYDKVWLIYLDNYHPRWKATVNGKPASIARANIAFKAVKLEKGYNIVKFTFENLRNKIYMMIFFILGVISSLILIISVIFLSIPSSYNYIRGKVFSWKQ